MPFNMGMGEMILILLVILLFFGAKRIPEIAGSFGKGIKEFKKNVNEAERAIREDLPRETESARMDQRLSSPVPDTTPRADDTARPEPKRLLN